MIAYLKGKIINKTPNQIILDVNGVGYQVYISLNTFQMVSENENFIELFIYTSVKEDSISLFGFFYETEKIVFQYLISVSGIGPKLALNILSGIGSEDFFQAVIDSNIGKLISIPGIGRKTAERIILELKDKFKTDESIKTDRTSFSDSNIRRDSVSALVSLGFQIKNVEKVINTLIAENDKLSLEEVVKLAIQRLNL